MNTTIVLQSILVMGTVSGFIALLLSFAAKKFRVEVDPRKEAILEILPGANCAACGYTGCEQYAEALIDGNVDINLCKPGGQEVVVKIAEILKKEVATVERKVAVVLCNGGVHAKDEFIYDGIKRCDIAFKFYDGRKVCKYGCIGYGDCAKVCPFDAIRINKYGIAEVDRLKCTGCGLCVNTCPKGLIKLVPCKYQVHILCNSKDKGVIVRQICTVGCIGCGLCVKSCPVNDIVLNENLAIMKYNKCNNCGVCMVKCPTKTIISFIGTSEKEVKNFSLNLAK
ncbi:MAG: RnfABCDGE type electron transport complex subunit B [Endomicrobia bacterium]|nr:RnfABCDGE type electron transport complex subunit B [Endomicrobiia bacterium]MCX7941106.1 RnfABCDGE type electron transport complex subunit B [Endomicrobiia bacterium]MDW8055252.1 RnfABCDGE type electron transport complex subunit B [Elusimicrobiota bacterium]